LINELFEELRVITDQCYPTAEMYLTIKQYCEMCLLNDITATALERIKVSQDNIQKILNIENNGISIDKNNEDKKIIQDLANCILELITIKENIDNVINNILEKNYPNFYKIATPTIASKMLVISGSIERLAGFPASTIQLLGAEKSFFKAIKLKRKTPKYGVIYNHPLLIELPDKEKARFARFLSAKISLAVKADADGKDISKILIDKINNKIKMIKNDVQKHNYKK